MAFAQEKGIEATRQAENQSSQGASKSVAQPMDFHHKVSTELVRRFDLITVKEFNIRGMVKNHHLAQAISDVAWGSFFKITERKAENAPPDV